MMPATINYWIQSISLFVLSALIFGCNSSNNNKSASEITKLNVDTNYNPREYSDTLLYVGKTNYSDSLDKFDTLYTDTAKVYRSGPDSIYFLMNEIKYKENIPFDGDKMNDVTVVQIYSSFQINDSNKYDYKFTGEYVVAKTNVTFTNSDSIHVFEFIDRSSEGKKERRFFEGKLLK